MFVTHLVFYKAKRIAAYCFMKAIQLIIQFDSKPSVVAFKKIIIKL